MNLLSRPRLSPSLAVLLVGALALHSSCSSGAPASVSAPKPAPGAAPSAEVSADARGRELVERAVAAMGGAKVVDGVKSLEIHGKAKRIFPSGEEVPITISMQMLYPDRYRQEIELPSVKLTTVIGPEGAYTDMGDGPILLPDPQRVEFESGFRRNLISLLRARTAPGFRAEAKGKNAAGNEEVEVTASPITVTLVLDPKSGRVLQMKHTSAEGIRLNENVTEYSDWRTVSGLTYPYATSTSTGGKPANTIQVETIAVDAPLDAALFRPKTAPVPAEGTDPPVPAPIPAATPHPR